MPFRSTKKLFMDVPCLVSFACRTYQHIMCNLPSQLITHLQRAANEFGASTIPTHGRRRPPPFGPTSFAWGCPTPPSSSSFWPRGSTPVCCTIPTRASIRPWSWSSATSSPRWTGGIWSVVWPWRRATTRGRTGAFQLELCNCIVLQCRCAFLVMVPPLISIEFSSTCISFFILIGYAQCISGEWRSVRPAPSPCQLQPRQIHRSDEEVLGQGQVPADHPRL